MRQHYWWPDSLTDAAAAMTAWQAFADTTHVKPGQRTTFRVVAPDRATARPLEMVGLTKV